MKEKKIIKKLNENKWLILGLIITFLIVYSDMFFGNFKVSFTNTIYNFPPFNSLGVDTKGPLLSDIADQNYTVFFNYIHQFNFSFWNPQVILGAPLSLWFYLFPLHYLYLLPLDLAIFLVSLFKFMIAFTGMYLLLREYGANKAGSFIAGITYTFSSILVYWHGWPHTSVAMLAPFMFLFLNKFLKTMKLSHLMALTLVTYLALVAGMPTYTAYFLYLLGVYVLVYGFKYFYSDKKKLMYVFGGFAVSMLLAILASLPYTGDLLTTVGSNGYSESRKYLSSLSLNLDYLRTLIFPTIRGENWPDHANESTLYTGMLAILFLPFACLNRKQKPKINFWIVTTMVIFLLLFTNVFDIIYSHLPMINTSLKTRLIVLVNFTLPIILGLNITDLVKNRSYYLKKKYLVGVCLAIVFVLFIIASKSLPPFSELSEKNSAEFYRVYAVMMGGMFSIFILIVVQSKKIREGMLLILSLLCIWDMATFANDYLPFIEKSAAIVPEPTDSIRFIQDGTKENEKIVGFGQWTFFPSSNVYYDVRDIRGHDFILTNTDITTYYDQMSDTAFDSPTRATFEDISNMNLLKYLGVKYMTSDQLSKINDQFEGKEMAPTAVLSSKEDIQQEFVTTTDDLNQLSFLVGNYGNVYENEKVVFDLIDPMNNTTISRSEVLAKDILDNSYLTVQFPDAAISKGQKVRLRISSTVSEAKPLAFYVTSDTKVYEGSLMVGNQAEDGLLVMIQSNSEKLYFGQDGLFTSEVDEFAPQVEIVDHIVTEKSQTDVLNAMSDAFQKNTLFVTEKVADRMDLAELSTAPLSSEEQISAIKTAKDGTMTFTTELKDSRAVLINEYNDQNWNVFIDGKEQKEKAFTGNYMMRAIKVPEGKHDITIKYEPQYKIKFIKISGIVGILYLVILIFMKPIEKRIRKRLN